MTKATHVIITRYNLGVYSGGWHVRLRPSMPQWMDHRFTVFKEWAVPSIAGQLCKNFRWLILFDPKTTDEQLADITRGIDCVPARCPVPIGPTVADWINANVNTEWLITTRFDTDDALDNRFVSELQAAACEQKEVLCFPSGWWIKGTKTFTSTWHSNPFSTLVERAEQPCCITCCNHDHLRKRFSSYRELPNRRWIHVTHGGNISNCWYVGAGVPRSRLYDGFPFLFQRQSAIEKAACTRTALAGKLAIPVVAAPPTTAYTVGAAVSRTSLRSAIARRSCIRQLSKTRPRSLNELKAQLWH